MLSRWCRFSKSLITFFLGIVLALQTASWAVAAPSTFQEIQKNKLLKVCIWPDYFGISYRNSRTNVLEGPGVDMFFDPTAQTIDFSKDSASPWKVEDGDPPPSV